VGEACDAFAASNRLEPRAGTLINLGLCREQNRQLASAWVAFKDALTRVKDPKKKKVAVDKVATLEPRLSYLTISVPDESRVEGLVVTRNGQVVDPALLNRAVPVDGGPYTIAGRAPGHEEWTTTVEVATERDKVSVDVPRFKELAALVGPTGPTGPTETNSPAPDVAAPSRFTGRRKLALAVGATGLVGDRRRRRARRVGAWARGRRLRPVPRPGDDVRRGRPRQRPDRPGPAPGRPGQRRLRRRRRRPHRRRGAVAHRWAGRAHVRGRPDAPPRHHARP
jgi:hypothetical protein